MEPKRKMKFGVNNPSKLMRSIKGYHFLHDLSGVNFTSLIRVTLAFIFFVQIIHIGDKYIDDQTILTRFIGFHHLNAVIQNV